MPENETLTPDTQTASRWRPLMARLDRGESPTDIFLDLEVEFYASLRRVWKQWRDRGIDPTTLLDAAVSNPDALHELVRRSGCDSYAQLVEDVIAGEPGVNLEGLICIWLNAVWESVRGQLQLDRRGASELDDFADQVNRMLNRLIRLLVQNPSRIPPHPRRDVPPDIDEFLDQSLL